MSRFTAIPDPPQTQMSDWQFYMFTAIKQNLDLLTGLRQERDGGSQAITRSSVTITSVPAQSMRQITAQGASLNIEGATVPAAEDYVEALKNLQQLANDVANLYAVVNTLIRQLRG